MWGAIRDKWKRLGADRSLLGYPVIDEQHCPDTIGHFQHFERGSIYHQPALLEAREVHGAIRDKWASVGWERSFCGYPTTDEMDVGYGGRASIFQGSWIVWNGVTGAHSMDGDIAFFGDGMSWSPLLGGR